jgi:hypothetical protein
MATTAATDSSCFPCWSGAAHQVSDLKDLDMGKGNWQRVTLNKLNSNGELNAHMGTSRTYTYILDSKTGDLYLDETKATVAMKSYGIFLGAPIYAGLVIMGNLMHIALDVASIAWRVLSEFGETWKSKGALDALLSVVFAVVWEMPKSVALNIWGVVRTPMYAVGVMLAAAWGVVSPYEGRKMVGKIEKEWHDGLTYKDDFRMGKDDQFLSKMDDCKRYGEDCSRCFGEIKAGKVWFLGWCMQVRGNIHDKVGAAAKFTLAS